MATKAVQCKNQVRMPTPAMCMEHYSCVYDNNFLITVLVDPASGEIVDVNKAAADFYGYPLRDFRKLSIRDLQVEDDGERSFLEQAMPGGQFQGNRVFIDKHRLASGRIIDVEIHTGMIPMLGRLCIYTVIFDISERIRTERKLRESEEGYRDLVELCPEAILVYGGGTIRFANQQAEQLFGYNRGELIGRSIEDFFAEVPLSSSELGKFKTLSHEKGSFRVEQRFIRQDQRMFELEISGAPIVYEEHQAVQLVLRDITDAKKEIEQAALLQEHRHTVAFPLERSAALEKLYLPAETLSGDFFIFHKISENVVIGMIGDVTGKGITAALGISALRVLFLDSLSHSGEPMHVVQDLNRRTLRHMDEDYIAGCCFRLDFAAKELTAVGAGINQFRYAPAGGTGSTVTVKGAPLGMFEDSEFQEQRISFKKGDRFCFYSDGMELLFGPEELSGSGKDLQNRLMEATLQDDCTWLGLTIL